MSQIFTIMRWEYLNRIRSKIFIITIILMPLLILGMSFLPSLLMDEEGKEAYRLGVIDDSGILGDYLLENIERDYRLANDEPKYLIVNFTDLETAKTAIINKEIDIILLIPDTILVGACAEYYASTLSNFKLQTDLRKAVQNAVVEVRMRNENIDYSLIKTLTRPVGITTYEVSKTGEHSAGNELASFLIPFGTMFLLFMSVFVNGQLLLRSVMEERTSRVVEVILSAVSPKQLMTGKILGLGALGLTQLLVYLAVGISVMKYNGMGANFDLAQGFWMVTFFLLGYFLYAAIFATMGTLFDSEQEAQQSTSVITIVAVIPMMMSTYFITNPASIVTRILSFLPPFTPFMMPLRMGTGVIAVWEILLGVVLLLASLWFLFAMAGKVFRVTLLMYGKRITLPELIRWIKA